MTSLNDISLPNSFDFVYTLAINNVSPALTSMISYQNSSSIDSLPSSSVNVTIPNNLWMNISSISTLLNRFTDMERLEIGDYDLETVKEFHLNGVSKLQVIEIGKNSFTSTPNSNGFDEQRSFEILNCAKLESITIGDYSFSDCASTFEIRSCPNLVSIQLGRMTFFNVLEVTIQSKDFPSNSS